MTKTKSRFSASRHDHDHDPKVPLQIEDRFGGVLTVEAALWSRPTAFVETHGDGVILDEFDKRRVVTKLNAIFSVGKEGGMTAVEWARFLSRERAK